MEKKTLIAILLSLVVFMGYQQFVLKKTGFNQESSQAEVTTASQGVATNSIKTEETRALAINQGNAVLAGKGELLKSFTLADYPVALASVTHQDSAIETVFDQASGLSDLKDVQGVWSTVENAQVWTFEDDRLKWVKTIRPGPQKNSILFSQSFTFKKSQPTTVFVGLSGRGIKDDPEENDRKIVYFANQTLESYPFSGDVELKEVGVRPDYVGITDRYFVLSILNRYNGTTKVLTQPTGEKAAKIFMVFPVVGTTFEIPLEIYFGPKKLDLIRSVEPKLDHTVDFGWFTFFGYGLLKTLNFLYDFTKNYGVSIILLTLLLKILTFPLTFKSMKSMKQMQKVQPMIQALKEKHKDNPQQMNAEMMQLMKSHGYNPVAGCLPILIQMPIFFALYRVLYGSIELYHAPFMLWISDLSLKDPLYITPVILTAVMYLQQRLTPSQAADPMQAKMIQFMPVFFGIFMISLPAGLTLYMLTNAVAGIIQQLYLNKKLDITRTPIAGAASA